MCSYQCSFSSLDFSYIKSNISATLAFRSVVRVKKDHSVRTPVDCCVFSSSWRPTEWQLFSPGRLLCLVSDPDLLLWRAAAEARCLGCSTGTVCPLSLPGSAAYGRAPVGRRRSESQEDRSGAGGRRGKQYVNIWKSEDPNLAYFVTIREFFNLSIFFMPYWLFFWECEAEMFGFALWLLSYKQHTANCRTTEPHTNRLQAENMYRSLDSK